MWFSWTFLIPPLFLLVAGAGARVKSPRWWIYLAVVTSFFLWFHEYFWLFAGVVGLVAAVVTLARKRPVDFGWIAGAIGVALLITGPALWLHIERRSFDESHNIKPVRTIEIAKKFSSDPADFLQPVDRSSLYLDLPKALTQESRYESINYLGLVGMLSLLALPVLIARGRLSAQQRRFLLATAGIAVAGVLFSLGPRIPTEGDFPGLSAFFYDHDVWPANQIAAWSRYGIFAFMWVASVVAFVYQALTRKLPRIWATVALLLVSAIVIFDQYPHFDLIRHETRVPDAMISTIERSPRDAYVMHLPLDGFGGVEYNAVAEFFQTFHERPIVNGYTPAINPAYVNLMRQAPIGCLNTYAVHPCPSTTAIGRYLEDSEIEWIVFERFRLQTVIESTQENPLLLHRQLKMIEGILDDLQKGGSIHTEYSDERYVVYRVNHP
jgi:hypothetical protein